MKRGRKTSKEVRTACLLYRDLKDIIKDETLRFLPAKSLLRCSLVCKDWKHHISSPFFIHTHSNSSRSPTGLFYQKPDSPPSFLSIDPAAIGVPDPQLTFLPEPVDIRASSNGLLCCQGRSEDKPYYICNPATKQFKKLPKQKANHGADPSLVLIFEPTLFNFVPSYKIICAFSSVDFEGAHEFEMYSSEDGTWKVYGEICFGNRVFLPKSGVHVNGVVYWETGPGTMVAFDYVKDRSQVISDYRFDWFEVLGAIYGKLCLTSVNGSVIGVCMFENAFSSTMPMSSGAKTWGVMHRYPINYADPAFTHEICSSLKQVLHVAADFVFLHAGRRIISHNMTTKRSSVLHGEAERGERSLYVPYVNSLVCL